MFSFIIYVFTFISAILWKGYLTIPFKEQPVQLLSAACTVTVITIILFVIKTKGGSKK